MMANNFMHSRNERSVYLSSEYVETDLYVNDDAHLARSDIYAENEFYNFLQDVPQGRPNMEL